MPSISKPRRKSPCLEVLLKPCVVCGKDFTRRNHSTTKNQKCCSFTCGHKLRQLKAVTRRESTCKHCGVLFRARLNVRGWEKHCSFACVKAMKSRCLQMRAVICNHCGSEFRRTFGAIKRVKRVFCSKECSRAHIQGPESHMWRGGSNPNRGAGWLKLAEQIRARDGYQCQRCNRTQEDNKQRLSVDHIQPWRLFETAAEANHPTNLISLCRRCHSWKTTVAEKQMLKGDNIQFQQYKKAITLPPLLAMAK